MQEDADRSAAPAVNWTIAEVVLVMLLAYLCYALAAGLLTGLGWFRWYYGDEFGDLLKAGGDEAVLASARMGLWTGCLAGLLQIALTLGYFRQVALVPFDELGLTTHNLRRNLLAGLYFALIFAPGAYGVQALAVLGMGYLGIKEQPHPFTQLGQQGLYPTEWILLVGMAVLLAPVWEELVYRGIVQPWILSRQPEGGPAAFGLAFLLAFAARSDMLDAARQGTGHGFLIEAIPFLALVLMLPVYFVLHRRSPIFSGLFASAVLFAWIHARVWPSPLALVWLALGLGWLRWKSGSLVGCIVLHAVFNALACAVLLYSISARG